MWMQSLLSLLSATLGAVTRDQEEFVTELKHSPEGWWAVGCVALVAVMIGCVIGMYRREGRAGSSMRLRMALGAIRCLVLVGLLVILLEPVRVRILRRWTDSYTLVLVDNSSSMDLADTYRVEADSARVARALDVDSVDAVKRRDIAKRLMERNDREFLHQLAANNRIKFYTFSDEPTLVGTIRADREDGAAETGAADAGSPENVANLQISFSAHGPSTNIERAVRRAIDSVGGAPVAGVVVLSDGGFNTGASAEEVAALAHDRDVPVHVVGIGDASEPRNVRITEVSAPQNVFKQDPFAVTVRIASQGLDGVSIRVELYKRLASGGAERSLADTKTAIVGLGGAIEPILFEQMQSRVGRYVYTVEVPVLDDETVADDNSKQITVNVVESRTRVLLVSGGPSWDYRFVSRLLERDDTVNVSCWLQSADLSAVRDGNTIIDHLPLLPEELFAYDVIVLMGPDASEFDGRWARLADRFVTEHGGGLLLCATRAHTAEFMRKPGLKPLLALLPVTLDPEAELVINQIGHYQTRAYSIDVPEAVLDHAVMRLAGDRAENRLVWRGVGRLHWHFPVLREKLAATVLMRHGDPRMRNSYGGHVLFAVQYVGAGRTGFLAFDGTWRWRRHGEELFDRFWTQTIRFLAEGKLMSGSRRGILLTERDQYALGDGVTVTARLFNERFEPLQRDSVVAKYESGGQRRECTLHALRDRPGWFEGRFAPDHTGACHISVSLEDRSTGRRTEIAKEIIVVRPNIEVMRPQMDRVALRTLAEGSAGGRFFEVDELDQVAAAIPDLHEEITIRSRPQTLWDNGLVLALLTGLLAVEWGLRKWHRLL